MAADIFALRCRQSTSRRRPKTAFGTHPRYSHQIKSPIRHTEKPVLKLPEPLIRADGARVMSLTDGTRKMSKSDPSEQSRINLYDSQKPLLKK